MTQIILWLFVFCNLRIEFWDIHGPPFLLWTEGFLKMRPIAPASWLLVISTEFCLYWCRATWQVRPHLSNILEFQHCAVTHRRKMNWDNGTAAWETSPLPLQPGLSISRASSVSLGSDWTAQSSILAVGPAPTAKIWSLDWDQNLTGPRKPDIPPLRCQCSLQPCPGGKTISRKEKQSRLLILTWVQIPLNSPRASPDVLIPWGAFPQLGGIWK